MQAHPLVWSQHRPSLGLVLALLLALTFRVGGSTPATLPGPGPEGAPPSSVPSAAAFSRKLDVVPKWDRFEHAFKSTHRYAYPLQDARLRVRFTSPSGQVRQVDGFWDGGRVWRVRFCPDQPGMWKFQASCSDPTNLGLNEHFGEFLCSAPVGTNRFHVHGPLQVASDRRHFEHLDGTPFFWLADTVWEGARKARPKAWEIYAQIRFEQHFSAARWVASPGLDARGRPAYASAGGHLTVDPKHFQSMEGQLERLNHAGLLSVVAPLWETLATSARGETLPEDQAIALVRYTVARWGAEPVAWLLGVPVDPKGENVGRWQRIGRAVFGEIWHAPVVVYAGDSPWVLEEFRAESWADAFGFAPLSDATDDALQYALAGPLTRIADQTPPRPLVPVALMENARPAPELKRSTAAQVRRAAYLGLFLAPPCGLGYAGAGVANWDTAEDPDKSDLPGAEFPLWRKSLFMPAAKQAGYLADLMSSLEFWRLRPCPGAVAASAASVPPSHQILAAVTPTKDLALVYAPVGGVVGLNLDELPPAPVVTSFNPRTGETGSLTLTIGGGTARVAMPDSEDWVLVLKQGRGAE